MFLVGLAESVELPSKFPQEESAVDAVSGGGKFPVDIEAIEDACGRDSATEITGDEEIDATGDEGLAAGGGAGGGREFGSTRERDEDLEIGMELLELLERGEIAVQRPSVGSAGDAGKMEGPDNRPRNRRCRNRWGWRRKHR